MITIREPFYNYFKYDPGRKVTRIYTQKKAARSGQPMINGFAYPVTILSWETIF
ncbi:hypothetical protein BA6E_10574 [Bacteroidales bacterium 6E]|nr:hypothetical protein BA6E_10574 [Bacteroidales bacterium 6E]